MLLNKILLVALSMGAASAAPYWKRDVDFAFGSEEVRGVNIGGWLILEPYITPSIFQAQDGKGVIGEWTFTERVSNAEEILRNHWSSWVSLGDFQKIADAGFNTVRIPIGYWAFKKYDDPFIMGAQEYLDQGIAWARQTGLKVWIDLHGAPLSQNGYDNSGHRVTTPGWTTGDSVAQTEEVLGMIADKYAITDYQDVVVAIEVLNEPLMSALAGGRGATEGYYHNAYDKIRSISNTPVVIHDGFVDVREWNGFGGYNVLVDHHEYQAFTNETVAWSVQQHVENVCTRAQKWATGASNWVVVGEWSAAMTDCAPAVNGYGIGSRYDGTYSKQLPDGSFESSTYIGSCESRTFIDQWSQQLKDDTRAYIEAQMDVFEKATQGWIFWNFKTEHAAEWDLFRLLDAGVFPQPLTARNMQNTCSI